jgi:hypothetical protein
MASTTYSVLERAQGTSWTAAYANTIQPLDLLQIIDIGGQCLLNISETGVVNNPAQAPTDGTHVGVYEAQGVSAGGGSDPVATQLASAAAFQILAYSGITNTGASVFTGPSSIGSYPTNTITPGTPPWTLTNGAAVVVATSQNQTDLAAAITYYEGLATGGQELTTADMGTQSTLITPAVGPLTLTSVATSVGATAVYSGTITGGGSNAFVGYAFTVTGFTGSNNNVSSAVCTASTGSSLTLTNSAATAETHAASASASAVYQTAGTYTPGYYYSGSSLAISTPITLSGAGLYVFYSTASTVTQAAAGTINLTNGATAENIVWVVGSSWTTVGPGAVTVGNILAHTSVTLGGGSVDGRVLANNGAVTISTATTFEIPSAGSGTSTASIFAATFTNPQQYDVLQLVSANGGAMLNYIDYEGVSH